MSAILWFVSLLLIFALIIFSPLRDIILKFLYKNERITPSSSTAQNNVRIHNEYSGATYVPITVEPIREDEYNVRVESTEAPYRESVLTFKANQLKHDPIEVLKSGLINYRLIKPELNTSFGINDDTVCDPTFTTEENRKMSEESFRRNVKLEGEIMNLKANNEEAVDKAIERTSKLTAPKYQGGNT